jgi:hypothetical protein
VYETEESKQRKRKRDRDKGWEEVVRDWRKNKRHRRGKGGKE